MLSQIQRWSEQAGLTAKKIEDPSADFHLVISEPKIPPIGVIHPQADSEFILFYARVVPPEDFQKKLLDFDTKQRSELISDIRLRLFATNLEFNIVGAETGVPSAYDLYSKFFFEGNTIQSFWQTYVQMKSAVVTIIFLHQRFLGLT